ncbi:MAG TPA: DUF1508 domain-containing protein, partial [Rubricoccaceae bacterium]
QDQDDNDQFRWRFRAANGETVASGEGYREERDCRRAVEILQQEAADADVQDLGRIRGGGQR